MDSSSGSEVLGRLVAVDILLSPSVMEKVGAAPDTASETVPKRIRTRDCSPR